MKYYAGIGSRLTPPAVQEQMTSFAAALESAGYILRSGAAVGADTAFEKGVKDPANKQIFLPWRGYNDHPSKLVFGANYAARTIAACYHPVWHRLTEGVRKLMTRNVAILYGPDLTQAVEFIVCWTPPDGPEGGTGMALRIARDKGIPIYNLNSENDLALLQEKLNGA